MEQRKIIQNATRRNKLKSGGTDVNETIEAEGNLQDVIELLANLRKNKEPLLHCSVFIELKARNMDVLKELQSDIAMELTRSKISVDRLTLRQKEGFLSVIPTGYNQFGAQYERVLPASSVANLYPFNFSGKTDPQGYIPAPKSVQCSRMWQLYRTAKELLDRESDAYDPNTAVELLIGAAELGCGVAKYRLGKMFLRGEDVPKNIEYALRWLEESVSEGNQYAEYLLGKTLLRGGDVEQNIQRGEKLLRRSSNQGNRYASYMLGKTLLDGELLLQDIPEAIRLLTDSADKKFAAAQYQMGKLLYRGEVIQQDIARAIDYLERAAGQKNPYAAYLAGKIRLTEAEVKDVFRAIRNFEIAAENGNDYAAYQLGKIYLYGKKVERDDEKAIAYLSVAAEHGNSYAEQLLHSIRSNRNWSVSLGAIQLLQHLSRLIQNQLDDEKKGKAGAIDRKLKRKIDEKKQAHGLKQG